MRNVKWKLAAPTRRDQSLSLQPSDSNMTSLKSSRSNTGNRASDASLRASVDFPAPGMPETSTTVGVAVRATGTTAARSTRSLSEPRAFGPRISFARLAAVGRRATRVRHRQLQPDDATNGGRSRTGGVPARQRVAHAEALKTRREGASAEGNYSGASTSAATAAGGGPALHRRRASTDSANAPPTVRSTGRRIAHRSRVMEATIHEVRSG